MTSKVETEIQLTAISPISFEFANVGDVLTIKRSTPRRGEYRGKIGAAMPAFLVFKGGTKIGMIPRDVVARVGPDSISKSCRISRIDKGKNLIAISLGSSSPANAGGLGNSPGG